MARKGQKRRRAGRRPAPLAAAAAPPPPAVHRGVVKWYSHEKGYGFIQCADGREVFVHESAVVLGPGSAPLAKGQAVEFELRETAKGQQAFSVIVLGNGEPRTPGPAPAPAGAPKPPQGELLDMAQKPPESWYRKGRVFVYTYTLYGRRNG
jgi:CspA family cold shock protein